MSTKEDFISYNTGVRSNERRIWNIKPLSRDELMAKYQMYRMKYTCCISEVEKFILKNISKFDDDTLTDIADMWHAIGGDPELPMTDKEIYDEVCIRG